MNQLKTSITTLINSRTREARFAGVVLIKTAVDVGGWEVLQGTKPWVGGLLAIVQKGDPMPVKELAIVALTRIYVLLQPYQTLVREIATQTIPAFATECLKLIKPLPSGEVRSTPLEVVETVCDALTKLIPLYPATFRPSSNQTIAAIRPFLAPTESDSVSIPVSLRQAARRLNASQHFVAAKSGGSDEWLKLIETTIEEIHATADQVLRAVDESWEPSVGNPRPSVSLEKDPAGGGSPPSQLPAWSGILSGAQRLVGLFGCLAAYLFHATKGPVALPLTKITEAITRVCLIARLSPKTLSWEQALQVKAAVGREEKDELWSVVPDIHVAAVALLQTLFQRLRDDMLPYAPESLDHLLRVFGSGIEITSLRSSCYAALNDILSVSGPTLSKSAIDMLQVAIGACCRDLQEDAGFLKQSTTKLSSNAAETKKNGLAANADLFLQKPDSSASEATRIPLEPGHKSAASALLVSLLSSIPQQYLKPSHRSLLDQTAILTRNRDAMVASVLNPYTDPRGKRYASILPHLTQQFPNEQDLEILRTNLRPDGAQVFGSGPTDDAEDDDDDDDDDGDASEDEEMGEPADADSESMVEPRAESVLEPGTIPAAPQVKLPVQPNPFEAGTSDTTTVYGEISDVQLRAASPPKRKNEEAEPQSSKRQELQKPELADKKMSATAEAPVVPEEIDAGDAEDGDDDSDESVHLNMELEDDDDDDEED